MNTTEKSMAQMLLNQAKKESGWHSSRSDSNTHLSIKNADGTVIGHIYKNGTIKGTNQNGTGALPWLLK